MPARLQKSARSELPDGGNQPILEARDISKSFPGVKALDRVNFQLFEGEILGLVGENGAGKSTLMKILSGVYSPDEGEIIFRGDCLTCRNSLEAARAGIGMVHQELSLLPNLTVAENIYLGRENRFIKWGVINWKKMYAAAQKRLDQLGFSMNPKAVTHSIPFSERQMVEIAKAFSVKSKICIFDEPTAALTPNEIKELFLLINRLKKEKVGIIYISHRLEEVYEIGSRITVLRNGRYIDTKPAGAVTTNDLVEMMIGRSVDELLYEKEGKIGAEVLRVENLGGARFKNINMSVRAGEIVGLAGLVGAGRTEVLRGIFGADRITEGSVYLRGEKLNIREPKEALRHKIALLPEDRKDQGLVLCRPVEENIILSSLDSVCWAGVLKKNKIGKRVKHYIDSLSIKTPSQKQIARNLSGGNQQKVIIARWLSANCDVMLFDEPTRGIDVGAKQEVYALITDLAKNGTAIVVVSSEIPELLRICDRIYVMHEGEIKKELPIQQASTDKILNAAFGRV